MGHQHVEPHLRRFARAMRKTMTESEFRLWNCLRNRGLDGHKFRRQVPIGAYIADFYCSERRLIVEVDGGHHFDEAGLAADARRTRWLESDGHRILRFSNLDVLTNIDGVCAQIMDTAAAIQDSP